MHKFGVQATL